MPVATLSLPPTWTINLALAAAPALAPLRRIVGLEIAIIDQTLWLRGPALPPTNAPLLQRLPAEQRFDLLADNFLRSPGARVPHARLPADANWTPLSAWLTPQLPSHLPAAPRTSHLPLRLVRGSPETTPEALLVSLNTWTHWAAHAPAIRLQPLRFAVCIDPAQVLVLGQPLPPLPGQRLVSHSGFIIPAGCRWEPPVAPAVLRQLHGLRPDDLALWPHETAPISLIPAESLVRATRAAIRLTTRENAAQPISA